ncbi:MAG: AbrB/MazE/SpoVT family DNA-binding domain-containing protein [Nitrosotalea sp.]
MPKLQRVKAYEYKDHPIYKYRLNIPAEYVQELNWKEGSELSIKIKNKKLEIIKENN